MSDIVPSFLPDNFNQPIDDAVERKKAVAAARAATIQPIQSIFVNHLFECNMDIATAAIRTGVKTDKARSWVENDGPVFDLISSRLQEMAKASKVSVDVIVDGLYAEATRMPAHDEDKTVSMSARVAAWAHLAKFKGMFDKGGGKSAPRVSVNINIDGNAPVAISGEEDDGNT